MFLQKVEEVRKGEKTLIEELAIVPHQEPYINTKGSDLLIKFPIFKLIMDIFLSYEYLCGVGSPLFPKSH